MRNITWIAIEVEVNLRPTASRPVCLGVRHPSGIPDKFFFRLEISFRQFRVCYFVSSSLTRGWVCNLLHNCFWALTEQSLLGQSPAELKAIFYYLIWDSPNLEGQDPVFISSRNRVAQLYPRHWVPFLSPLTTRRDYGRGILTRLQAVHIVAGVEETVWIVPNAVNMDIFPSGTNQVIYIAQQ
jgi:hypothetical protein